MVEHDLTSGGWAQWPELPEGRCHLTMNAFYLHVYFFRYGHKCGRIEDMVVIVGGANERGDYVSSTMLLNIVTRQVWAPSIGNY